MSQKNIIIIALVLVIGLVSIIALNSSKPSDQNPQTAVNMPVTSVKPTTPDFETIATVQDLNSRLSQKNPNEVLLDVRTPEEFAQGHIVNAVNLDMENPNFGSEIAKLDKSKTYIVFCRSGNRALTASKTMTANGLKVAYSKEGITAWLTAKLPVVK